MKCLLSGEPVVQQRAAWVYGICAGRYPYLVKPYMHRIIGQLQLPVHDAVKRNIIRALQFTEVPVKQQGQLIETLMHMLVSMDEPVAVKIFAMQVLLAACRPYPDLKRELALRIETQLPFATPGFRAKGKKVIMELQKQ